MEERLYSGAGKKEIEKLLVCVAVFEVENLSKRNFSRREFILERSTNGAFTLLFLTVHLLTTLKHCLCF